MNALRAAQAIDAGEIARQCTDTNLIAEKVLEARIVAVESAVTRE
jgi:hypothetical protein